MSASKAPSMQAVSRVCLTPADHLVRVKRYRGSWSVYGPDLDRRFCQYYSHKFRDMFYIAKKKFFKRHDLKLEILYLYFFSRPDRIKPRKVIP